MSNGNKNVGKNGKPFAPSFGFWPAKSGRGYTVSVNGGLLETLAKATPGSTLLLTETPSDAREENDRLPHYRVTILPPMDKQQASDSL